MGSGSQRVSLGMLSLARARADGPCRAACEDGAIHVWAASSSFARPNAVSRLSTARYYEADNPLPHQSAEKAHEKGTVTSGLVFSADGKQLASRGGDGTVKRESSLSAAGARLTDSAPLQSGRRAR